MINELLAGFPVVVDIPVAWGEMDAFQHVNNTSYFRYFENARIAYFEKTGMIEMLRRNGIGPILGFTSCKYKLPITYPDTVSVGAKTEIIEHDRFTMKYVVVSQRHQKIAAEGDGVVVIYDYHTGKKAAMPDELKKQIVELEKSGCFPSVS